MGKRLPRMVLTIGTVLVAVVVACADDPLSSGDPTGDGGIGTDGATGVKPGDGATSQEDASPVTDAQAEDVADADASGLMTKELRIKVQALVPPPVEAGVTATFGSSVAIDGDRAVIGASGEQAAYVYRRLGGAWTLEARLAPNDGGGGFGQAVAIEGTTVLVGAPYRTDVRPNAGQVYVFKLETGAWVEKPRIKRSFGVPGSPINESGLFGLYVQLVNGRVFVAAPGESYDTGAGVSPSWGALYIFNPNGSGGWSSASPMYAADGQFRYNVGSGMRTDGRTIVAGCGDRCNRMAYLFESDGGVSSPWMNKYVDASVSNPSGRMDVSDDRFVVSASHPNDGGSATTQRLRTFERNDAGVFTSRDLFPLGPEPAYVSRIPRLLHEQLVVAMTPSNAVGRVGIFARDAGAWSLVKEEAFGGDGGYPDTFTALAWDGTWGAVSAPMANSNAGTVFFFTLVEETVPAK